MRLCLIHLAIIATVLSVFCSSAYGQESVTRGPYLQLVTETSIIIRWRTDIAVGSAVRFATNIANLSQEVSSATLTTEHSISLSGLQPNTRYYYAIGKPGSTTSIGVASHTFKTAPTEAQFNSTRIWVLGDSGTADANAGTVRDAFKTYASTNGDADFMLMLGDNAYNSGTDPEYQAAVFDTYPEILAKTPLWSTLGNHDGYSANSATQTGPYYEIFSLPTSAEAGGVASGTKSYYSFDYGDIHFVCLNSYDVDRSPSSPMALWLQSDLDINTKNWLVVFFHHPPYTKGSHDSDAETQLIEMRENIVPILENAGVDLILTGHSHSYERSYLIDGHYDSSTTFTSSMKKDAGDGNPAGDGAYQRHSGTMGGHAGAVYAVAGSSGKISGGSLNHPAMVVSLNQLGSMILEIDSDTLRGIFLNSSGATTDTFTIEHTADGTKPTLLSASATSISQVVATFSEPLQASSIADLQHFSLLPSGTILSATLSADKLSVTFTTTPLTVATPYALLVEGVTDISGNVIAPGAHAIFRYIVSGTMAFQNGVSPNPTYAGNRDTVLSQQNPTTNYHSEVTIAVDGDDPGSSNNDLVTLLYWDVSLLPADATVTAASITLTVTNTSSETYHFYKSLRNWTDSEATWNSATVSDTWQSAGAQGALDRSPTILANAAGSTLGATTFQLNTDGLDAINSWVTDSAQNKGLILANTAAADGLDAHSADAATANVRPILAIQYQTGAGVGDTTPPTAPALLSSPAQSTTTISLLWDPASDAVGVVSYGIYRDSTLIDIVSATSYSDTGLQSNTSYSYHIVAYDAAANISPQSNTLLVSTSDSSVDSDGDGVSDTQESLDGTDASDAGSFVERLGTESCTEWNGFLSMHNFLELINQSSSNLSVQIALYSINGSLQSTTNVEVPARGQWDHPVHEVSGFLADSYGLVCVLHSGAPGDLRGQMVLYRPKAGAFEFAMSLPLMNGNRNSLTASVNTHNPSIGSGNVVANWIQVTNLSADPLNGTLDFFGQDGNLLTGGSFSISLNPRSRIDISAHQFPGPYVGSVRWTPSSASAKASLRSVRYLYDNSLWQNSFLSAAPLRGHHGNGSLMSIPVDTTVASPVLEVSNTSDSAISFALNYYSEFGTLFLSENIALAPRETRHILLSSKFAPSTRGSITLDADTEASLIASIVTYEFIPNSELALVYVVPAREPVGSALFASYNSYIGHTNTLLITSVSNSSSEPLLTIRAANGTTHLADQALSVPALGALWSTIDADIGEDEYGTIELGTSVGSHSAWLLRRSGNNYVLPFEVTP